MGSGDVDGDAVQAPAAGDEEDEKASLVAAVRDVVEEIRDLSSREGAEDGIHEAKLRLAAAIKAATAAGVSQEQLLEATCPPTAEEEEQEADQEAAGPAGESTADAAAAQGEEEEAGSKEPPPLKPGDRVEVHGLQSAAGQPLNGKIGLIERFIEEKGRFQVDLGLPLPQSLKPDNLRLCPGGEGNASPVKEDRDRDRRRSPSSSSSSSGERAKRESSSAGARAKRSIEGLNPEEALEQLLTGKAPTKKRRKKKSGGNWDSPTEAPTAPPRDMEAEIARAAGAAAAAMAAAQEAAAKEPLKVGDRVEVHGLQSSAGQLLNGKTGLITKFIEEKGRFQVELGMPAPQSLKPENLRYYAAAGGSASFVETSYSGSTAGYTLL